MYKEYLLLTLLILGTLTIVGMFIHINARFGMRKAFLELINRKSFLAITVIIINTVISYSMIHFNELDKLSQPNQSQSIQKDKEAEQNNKQLTQGDFEKQHVFTGEVHGDDNAPKIEGLEQKIKNAFDTWAASNTNLNPKWIKMVGNVGAVEVNGKQVTCTRIGEGKFAITGFQPPIIINN